MKRSTLSSPPSSKAGLPRKSRRITVFILAAVAVLGVLALSLGLGLGLGLKPRGKDSHDSLAPAVSSASNDTKGITWRPAVGNTWQIVLIRPIQLDATSTTVSPDVDVFDIDLFDNSKSTFDALHRLGKKVVCYFSAGSFESNRPDSAAFKAGDKGRELDGWPGEYWLDIKSENVRSIMSKRIDLAAQKGCDAIDPDNVDAYVS
jgi:hypothetical protein